MKEGKKERRKEGKKEGKKEGSTHRCPRQPSRVRCWRTGSWPWRRSAGTSNASAIVSKGERERERENELSRSDTYVTQNVPHLSLYPFLAHTLTTSLSSKGKQNGVTHHGVLAFEQVRLQRGAALCTIVAREEEAGERKVKERGGGGGEGQGKGREGISPPDKRGA